MLRRVTARKTSRQVGWASQTSSIATTSLNTLYANRFDLNTSSCPLGVQRRDFRIISLGADTPEDVAQRAREKAARASRKYLAQPDPMLTDFPDGVGTCVVFRNVISSDEEQIIWEELMPILSKDGTMHFAEATKVDERRLRNTYLELYGMKPYTDVKNWKKQETKQVPGFVWTPTLVKWLQAAGPEIESWLNKASRLTPLPPKTEEDEDSAPNCVGGVCVLPPIGSKKEKKVALNTPQIKRSDVDAATEITGPVEWLDMGRIVEHSDPGYEMHTEHPTTGRYFIYLNLLSDTVLTFDDEATGRVGKVLLPQRSLMLCSSELRWGWRVGEHSSRTQVYEKTIPASMTSTATNGSSIFRKTVTPDVRLSIQLWKYDIKLADRRHLQSQVESSVRQSLGGDMYAENGGYDGSADPRSVGNADAQSSAFKINAFNLGGDGANPATVAAKTSKPLDMSVSTAPNLDDSNNYVGLGKLGGDLVAKADKDAQSTSKSNDEGTSDKAPSSSVPATQKNMADMDKDFSKYKDSFSRLTGLMGEMKTREDAGMKVSDEWLKDKMNFSKDGDEYGFDPVNPERTWEQIENKARFYRDQIKSMDYDGTNAIGKPAKKQKEAAAKETARDTMDAELIIEGVEESSSQRQKRLDDDEGGDGEVNGMFAGFGNPNRSPADMRAAMEKLLPKDKADRMLASMPSNLGPSSGMGR